MKGNLTQECVDYLIKGIKESHPGLSTCTMGTKMGTACEQSPLSQEYKKDDCPDELSLRA